MIFGEERRPLARIPTRSRSPRDSSRSSTRRLMISSSSSSSFALWSRLDLESKRMASKMAGDGSQLTSPSAIACSRNGLLKSSAIFCFRSVERVVLFSTAFPSGSEQIGYSSEKGTRERRRKGAAMGSKNRRVLPLSPLPFLWLDLLLSTAVVVGSAEAAKVPAIYVFGDSTADVGNNNYLPGSRAKAHFPHNGIDFPFSKPTGRFSNGDNGVDFLDSI